MRFELKDYQEAAVQAVLKGLRAGSREYAGPDPEHTAVSLAAPTGAGKTVIASAVIERVLFGDNDSEPDPEAVFLWVTDDPSLNAQTRKKILESSDRLQPSQLVTIEEDFDQDQFDRRRVYFLNLQKLSRSTTFVRRREGVRRHTLWESMGATIAGNGGHYYLVLDEAHRGTGARRSDARTNALRLIHGESGLLPAAPVVWGISATPKRFIDAVEAAAPTRVLRRVDVPVEEVRESGLLKDVLDIQHRGEDQTMAATLIREAVGNLKAMDDAWASYTAAEGDPPVNPVLVIQVPDDKQFGPDEVGEVLDLCAEQWPQTVADGAVRHSYGQHTSLRFGEHAVRYIAPQDIQDNPRVRVVVFKEALTTGWDCPRAEVMLSLRTARDDTYIAQLIGRMVRAPLARRIESDDRLNRVHLYLPRFDTAAVKKVAEMLQSDPEGPATTVEINTVDAPRNPNVPKGAFDAFLALPTYTVPGPVHRSQVVRLHKLAALLVADGLLPDAISHADTYLAGVLDAERARLAADGTLNRLVADVETAATSSLVLNIRTGTEEVVHSSVATAAADLDLMFKHAATRLRDGLAAGYWSHIISQDPDTDPAEGKAIVVALASDPAVIDKVEADAESRVGQWLVHHGAAISGLSEDRRAHYSQVRAMAKNPEATTPQLGKSRSMPNDADPHTMHFFSDPDGIYRADLGPWEKHVLQVEASRPGFSGWYRNPVGGQQTIRIPYETAPGKLGKLHPDFVFFHADDDGAIRASLVDPHGHHLSDAGPKLRGLAEYARTHKAAYWRILAVIKTSDDRFYQLDLTDDTIRGHLATANSRTAIEAVFTTHGAVYG